MKCTASSWSVTGSRSAARTTRASWTRASWSTTRVTDAAGLHQVCFRWLFNPKLSKDYFMEEDGFPDREVNELSVAVIQARSLPAVDRKAFGSAGGCADPQATVIVGRNRYRTEYIKMSLAPKWDTVFKIPLTEEQGSSSPSSSRSWSRTGTSPPTTSWARCASSCAARGGPEAPAAVVPAGRRERCGGLHEAGPRRTRRALAVQQGAGPQR